MSRQAPISSPRFPAWLTERFAAFIIIGLSIVLYANTLGHEYAVDDAIVIYENEFTQKGIAGIPDIWKYDSFRGFFKEAGKENLVSGGRYRPLSVTTFAIERQLFGPAPWSGHLFNILLYALLGWFLFRWLAQLIPDKDTWKMAFLIALLFAAHPVHVEVVANIKGRDEILCLLLTLIAARYFLEKTWLSAVFLFFALTAKEMAVTALVWIPLAYVAFDRMQYRDAFKKLLPLAAAFVLYLILRFAILGLPVAGAPTTELMNNPFLKWDGSAMVPYSISERIASVLTIFSEYIRLLVFPVRLNHDYYPAALPVGNWSDVRAWFGLLSLLALVFIAVKTLRRPGIYTWTAAGYLSGFFLIGNLIFPIGTFMGERFLFMPSLFFAAAIPFFLREKLPRYMLLVVSILVAGYGLRTVTRNPVWKNDKTLFLHDVKTQPASAKLRNAAAGVLLSEVSRSADPASRSRQVEVAIGHLEKALEVHPLYKNAWLQLGNARYYLQQFSASEEAYLRALDIDPAYQLATKNLAIAYRDHGKQLGEKEGKPDLAIAVLKQSLEYRQDDPETFRLLGVAYGVTGRLQQAKDAFDRVIAMDPDNADGWYNLGVALMQLGKTEEGQQAIQKARELDPDQYK